ncbi:MAG: PDZ domain-containing protein [Planctomycetota bacterium]|nr:MAG: PDZ domain-containing protein [Planctomycetota bacterium]
MLCQRPTTTVRARHRLLLWIALLPLVGLAAPAGTAAEESTDEVAAARRIARAVQEEIQQVVRRTTPAFVVISGGSGVCIDPAGWVLTNHHVVAGHEVGDRWWVRMAGDRPFIARLVGLDPAGDIALLKLETDEPLPFVELGDSDAVRVGDLVIALGNPFGFAEDAQPTVTVGIVSANHLNRGGYSDAIQTDAPVNPGNSGGPLLDLQGRLLGINGRIAVRFGTRQNTGVGYAIPINQIRRFLPGLKAGGVVAHGKLEGLRLRNARPRGSGVQVRRIQKDSAGYAAGLRPGDRIVEAGGQPVADLIRFAGIVDAHPAGATLSVVVVRDGQRHELALPLAGPEPREADHPHGYLGVRLAVAESESEAELPGARIAAVLPGSPADKAGMRAGDRIVRIDGTEIDSPRTLARVVGRLAPGTRITVETVRGDEHRSLELTLADRSELEGGRRKKK